MERHDRPRWAPRVQAAMIRRLYEQNAAGIYDDQLVDEVGYAFLARAVISLHGFPMTRPSVGQKISLSSVKVTLAVSRLQNQAITRLSAARLFRY